MVAEVLAPPLLQLPGAVLDDDEGSFLRGRRIGNGSSCASFEARLWSEAVCAKVPHLFLEPHLYGFMDEAALRRLFQRNNLCTRFAEEVRWFSTLSHRHIVKYRGVVHGALFGLRMPTHLLMELCDGGTLRAAKMRAGGKLAQLDLIKYMGEACHGLAYLHAKGFAHRDIKPDSMLLHKGSVKLGDIGGFRNIQRAHLGGSGVTAYTAPEILLHGWPAGESPLAHSADVYALAVSAMDLSGVETGPAERTTEEAASLARAAPRLGRLLAAAWLGAPQRPRAAALAKQLSFPEAMGSQYVAALEEGLAVVVQEEFAAPGKWYGTSELMPGTVGMVEEVLSDGSGYLIFNGHMGRFHVALHFLPHLLEVDSPEGIKFLVDILAAAETHRQDQPPSDQQTSLSSFMWSWGTVDTPVDVIDPEVHENAAAALASLAYKTEEHRAMIVEAGAVPPLVAMLSASSGTMHVHAVAVLQNLTMEAENCIAVAEAGGIQPLVALLISGSSELRSDVAGLLWNMAHNAENQAAIADKGGIQPLVDVLREGSTEAQTNAAGALRNLAHGCPVNRAAIADAGAVTTLVALLSRGMGDVQVQATGAVMNLTDGSAQIGLAVADAGGIPPLVSLLTSMDCEAQQLAVGALRNLAATAQNRVAIAEAGAIEPLVRLVDSSSDATLQSEAAGALWNLAYRNTQNQAVIVEAGGIRALSKLLSGEASATANAAGALRNLVNSKVASTSDDILAPLPLLSPVVLTQRHAKHVEIAVERNEILLHQYAQYG